ncbi:hypothetical protein A3D03_02620 [Candidatus Gottesmanbacteria bacterium RIFCSPHIGHO2_02_FULL_40_13]|uniref:Transcobalamin-like C-terminal domain-containing protein n=1 Tax=Candidatus Gottesmanbacteria bacterium RIFCSPHIGHO2_02_FULL_40_13 TaxID=1798384 RepID=A0A1F6ABL9_9BACT|nr:MAG: hypothetical protein A3D03_02620 [Candidatus Gottesmanbacteria bacterium RIFCSPHIGHO2_02_FULL_40_13]
MKKQIKVLFTILGVVLIIGVLGFSWREYQGINRVTLDKTLPTERSLDLNKAINNPSSTPVTAAREKVNIDFGGGKIITTQVESTNAYEALLKAAKINNLQIERKEYKFGSLVTKIGDKENNSSFAWIYYVNGKTGQFSAEKFIIHPQDVVDWKYEKIK